MITPQKKVALYFTILFLIVGCYNGKNDSHNKTNISHNENKEISVNEPIVSITRNKKYSKPEFFEGSHGIKMISQIKSKGQSIDWILVVDDFNGSEEQALEKVTYKGRTYLKVGIPRQIIDNQKNWLLGSDDAYGIVYSTSMGSLVSKIEDIFPYSDQSDVISGFAGMKELFIQVDGHRALLYYDLDKDPDTGKFPWYLLDDIRYFSATEIVPKGYRPLWSLKVLDMKGFDNLDCSPRLNDKAIEKLRKLEDTYVSIRGLELSGNEYSLDALVLIPKSGLRTKEVRLVQFGNGNYQLFDIKSGKGKIINTLADVPNVIVEPLNEKSWNFREEYFVPYTMPY